MSKDILRVHTTIWPAMLLSLGLDLPKQLFIHGYFLTNGQKMSKSLGNVIAPADLIKKYGVDATRYLLMSATAFGHDGDITLEKFDEKYNADLANGLGNLVARVSNLIEKNNLDINVAGAPGDLKDEFFERMESFRIDEAIKIIWDEFRRSDEILTREQPWKLTDREQIKNILAPIVNNLVTGAELLSVVMPTTSEKITKIFMAKAIKKGEPLFPRIIN
jgi:methionyl-tRNA synthetase